MRYKNITNVSNNLMFGLFTFFASKETRSLSKLFRGVLTVSAVYVFLMFYIQNDV